MTGRFAISIEELRLIISALLDQKTIDLRLDNTSAEIVLLLDKLTAEDIRQRLTISLSKFGFDAAYKPNLYGRAMESLIDKFYTD